MQRLDQIRDDVRFALRQVRRSPGFTLVAVTSLALGIGATSAMFALADAALLRPLPFRDPDRLVMVWERRPNGFTTMAAPAEFREWAGRSRSFEAMAALASGSGLAIAGSGGAAELIPTQTVTARFFDVLGVTPVAGRTFVPGDVTSAANVVVMSEGLWRRRFAANASVVGRDLVLGGRPLTVIGIVPEQTQVLPPFTGQGTAISEPAGLWTLASEGGNAVAARSHYVHVIARLRQGATLDAAKSDLTIVADGLARESPGTNDGHGIAIEPLRDALIGPEVRLTAAVLFGVVGFLLLICCANIANLLLARASARMRELAVRSALGAARQRIIALLVTESMTLAAMGGICGLALAVAILRVAPTVVPPGLLPSAAAPALDARLIGFCAAITLAVGGCVGLVSAWQSTGTSIVQALAASVRTTRRGTALRGGLVVGEIAVAALVLSGAGLLLRTWAALGSVDPGYRAENVMTARVALPFPGPASAGRYTDPASLHRFYDSVTRELERQPGIRRIVWGSAMPFDGWWFGQPFDIQGDAPRRDGDKPAASYHMVSPEYFEALGIPLVSGRAFAATDLANGVPVCIVSEAFVRQYLRGRAPLGLRVSVPLMSFGPPGAVEREIVGVAGQIKGAPDEPRAQAQIYVPMAQNVWWSASLIVQPNRGKATALLPAVRAAVARVDPGIPIREVRTLQGIASAATSRPRFRALLVAACAALGLALAMVGVFGVLAYTVTQRTHELGVRIALGASRTDVLSLVLGGAARMALIGGAIGLALAAVLGRSMATFLFGVPPLDPVTFASVALVLIVTAAAAAAAPALRATGVDPLVAFRQE